jgi:hypothetical protein
MSRKLRTGLLSLVITLVSASSAFGAECFLKIEFDHSLKGEYHLTQIQSVYGNFYSQVRAHTLRNPYQHQLQLRNSSGDVLAASTTGGSLIGVGESFLEGDVDDAAASLVVERASKTLYLPALTDSTEVGVFDGSEFHLLASLSAVDLQCRPTCRDEGESLVGSQNCCQKLAPLSQTDGSAVCSKCGDGICSNWESAKNCRADCGVTSQSLECLPGVFTLTECASLVGYYGFEGNAQNSARRGNELFSKRGVTIIQDDNRGGIAELSGGHLNAGAFPSPSAISTLSVQMSLQRAPGRAGVLSLANRMGEGIIVAVKKGRPYLELSTRNREAILNGKKIRRKRTKSARAKKKKNRNGGVRVARMRSTARMEKGWNHLAITRKRSSVTGSYDWELWLNGEPAAHATTNFVPAFDRQQPDLLVGTARYGKRKGDSLHGQVDDVSVWNRALVDKEIQLLMK